LTYPGMLTLSRAHLTHLAGLIRAHRRRIGWRSRRLGPGRQALLVLAHLRNGDTYTRLAAGFGVGVTTVWPPIGRVARTAARRNTAWLKYLHSTSSLGAGGGCPPILDPPPGPYCQPHPPTAAAPDPPR
jgi:hypothetical protein